MPSARTGSRRSRPGNYQVTANLQGFVAKEVVEVRVGLGQIKKVDFALPLVGRGRDGDRSPRRRRWSTCARARARPTSAPSRSNCCRTAATSPRMVTQAPGANQETKLGGISIDGASAGENRFIIDGIETTNLQTGLSGTNLIADFVEEVQVKSSGFSAEFGGATRRRDQRRHQERHQQLHGMALYNFQGSATEGRRRPTLRQNLTNSDIAEYITYRRTTRNPHRARLRASAARSSRDRLWFFGAYLPAMTTTDRTVDTACNPGRRRTRNRRPEHHRQHHGAAGNSIRARASRTTAASRKLKACCRR